MSKVTAVMCNPVNCLPNRAELWGFFCSCMVEIVLYACSVLLVGVWTKYGNFYYCFLRFQGILFMNPWRLRMIWVGIGSRQCCLDHLVPLVRKYIQRNDSCKQLWAAPDFFIRDGRIDFCKWDINAVKILLGRQFWRWLPSVKSSPGSVYAFLLAFEAFSVIPVLCLA